VSDILLKNEPYYVDQKMRAEINNFQDSVISRLIVYLGLKNEYKRESGNGTLSDRNRYTLRIFQW